MGIKIKGNNCSEKVTVNGEKVKDKLNLVKMEQITQKTEISGCSADQQYFFAEIDKDFYIATAQRTDYSHFGCSSYKFDRNTGQLTIDGVSGSWQGWQLASGFVGKRAYVPISNCINQIQYTEYEDGGNNTSLSEITSGTINSSGKYLRLVCTTPEQEKFYCIDRNSSNISFYIYDVKSKQRTDIVSGYASNQYFLKLHKYKNYVFFPVGETKGDLSFYAFDLEKKSMTKIFTLIDKFKINTINSPSGLSHINVSYSNENVYFTAIKERNDINSNVAIKCSWNIEKDKTEVVEYDLKTRDKALTRSLITEDYSIYQTNIPDRDDYYRTLTTTTVDVYKRTK